MAPPAAAREPHHDAVHAAGDYRLLLEMVRNRVPALPVEEAFEVFSAAAPEGWRVELVEGEIRLTPPAGLGHEEIVSELSGQARDHRKDLGRYTRIGLRLPGATPSGRSEPDLVLAPKGSFVADVAYHDPAPALLVAEVISVPTGDTERFRKVRCYARAGVPVYLLVDLDAAQVVLCSRPIADEYQLKLPYRLSDTIPLPEPLGFDLDTSVF